MAVLTTDKQLVPRIDLHMHSTRSDGTDSPRGLLNKVRGAGIAVFPLRITTNTGAARNCCGR